MGQIVEFENTLTKEQMCAIPFINAEGYHSKTIAYSLYHIFRIEDIVAHSVIAKDEQIFLRVIIKNVCTPRLLQRVMNW